MEQLEELENVTFPTSKTKQSGKKRKWREIETLKERYRLQKELESIDMAYAFSDEKINV